MTRERALQHFDWFPTPLACTRELRRKYQIQGNCMEPCVGDGSIVRAFASFRPGDPIELQLQTSWLTNDLDPDWPADFHSDARNNGLYLEMPGIDWVITNPAFAITTELLAAVLPLWKSNKIDNVALYVRNTYNEVLKEDIVKRALFAEYPPTGLLFLPRVTHRRNGKGNWGSDAAAACWMIWHGDDREAGQQRIEYASEQCLAELEAEKWDFRNLIDSYLPPEKLTDVKA